MLIMHKSDYNGHTYFCRTEGQSNNVRKGTNEPFLQDTPIIKELIEKFPEKRNTFVDIGANIGTYSISLSRYFNKVLAYEPEPNNYNCLKLNVETNSIKNIIINNAAILNKNGYFSIENHDKSEGIHPGTYYINIDQEGNIPCRLLNDDLKELGIKEVGFIKIDTEGSELYILKSIQNILINHTPIVCVEINDCSYKNFGIPKEEILTFMETQNYKVYKIVGCNYYYIFNG